MPFQKGQSGNPSGRPPGARNKATIIAETLLPGEAEALTRLAIERAKSGDMTALRMCLDRLVPPGRFRTIDFGLPPLEIAADAASALAAITSAVDAGELTPAETGDLFKLVDGFARILEATILEQRIAKLERAGAKSAAQAKQITHDRTSGQKDPLDMYNFGDAP
jgi:hypothetical protein